MVVWVLCTRPFGFTTAGWPKPCEIVGPQSVISATMPRPFNGSQSRTYHGGSKWSGSWTGGAGFWTVTPPFAKLVIYTDAIHLRPTYRIMQPLIALLCFSPMPDIRLGWDQLELAECVRGSKFSLEPRGVRLWARGKPKPIIFWNDNVTSILDTLEAHNVRVDRSVHVSPLLGL